MRRQYHSRRVGDRTFIWDVHRLRDLTREHPVVDIPLSHISELDEVFWFRTASPTCRAVSIRLPLCTRRAGETQLIAA